MLMSIAAILAVVWLVGLIVGAGSMIHFVLAAAVLVFAYDMFVGRRHHTNV
jgi:hypothetical protein